MRPIAVHLFQILCMHTTFHQASLLQPLSREATICFASHPRETRRSHGFNKCGPPSIVKTVACRTFLAVLAMQLEALDVLSEDETFVEDVA